MAKNAMEIKNSIANEVDRLLPDMRQINRELFENPELCYEEVFATELTSGYLEKNGYSVTLKTSKLKTAFTAVSRGRRKGPNIAIIAEYDALPEIGHACGHSMIAASSCIAAVALKNAFRGHPGTITVIGTPAEEGGGGKIKMIKSGVFNDVDAAIMVHPSNKTRVVARMYAITDIEFTFTGKAAHAAAFPDRGVNALDAGVLFYNAVSCLRQQMKDEARVHGIFTHGGEAPNIIPEKAVLRFYIRALHVDYFEELKEKVINAARGAAKSTGCKLKVATKGLTYLPLYPNRVMGEAFRENIATLGITEGNFSETEEIGSSDIGNLSQVVPTLHPEYAIGGPHEVNHSRDFLKAVMSEKGEKGMIGMTKAMAMTVYDLLTDAKLMVRVKKSFAD